MSLSCTSQSNIFTTWYSACSDGYGVVGGCGYFILNGLVSVVECQESFLHVQADGFEVDGTVPTADSASLLPSYPVEQLLVHYQRKAKHNMFTISANNAINA